MMTAENRPKTTISRGQSVITDDPMSSALSIQFPFQSNVTYEIALNLNIRDNIEYISKNWNANIDATEFSEEFPTIALALEDSPEIPGDDPCASRPVVGNSLISANYYKKLKLNSSNRFIKTIKFYFSTTEAKNAFLIYFLPEVTGLRTATNQVPKSKFNTYISKIKITQKPFDSSYIDSGVRPPLNPDCGFRGGC